MNKINMIEIHFQRNVPCCAQNPKAVQSSTFPDPWSIVFSFLQVFLQMKSGTAVSYMFSKSLIIGPKQYRPTRGHQLGFCSIR